MTMVYARIANRTVADEYAAAQAHVASRSSATTPSPRKRPGEQLYERIMTELDRRSGDERSGRRGT